MTHLPPAVPVDAVAAQLAPLLELRGLTLNVLGDGILQVRNPAVAANDPRGHALNPGLNQRVTIAEHDGQRWFFWLWPGAERGGPPEPEPMVPVEAVEEAARLIGNVLRIDGPNGAGR